MPFLKEKLGLSYRFFLSLVSKRIPNLFLNDLFLPPHLGLLVPWPMVQISLAERCHAFAPDCVSLVLGPGLTNDCARTIGSVTAALVIVGAKLG